MPNGIAGNDFCNNELFNMVVHNVDPDPRDDECRIIRRGWPRVGKLLYEFRQAIFGEGDDAERIFSGSSLLVCVDDRNGLVDDHAFDGGGTYSPVLLGDFVPMLCRVAQGGNTSLSPGQVSATLVRISMNGEDEAGTLLFEGSFVFDSGSSFSPSPGSPITLEMFGFYTIDGVGGDREREFAVLASGPPHLGTYTLNGVLGAMRFLDLGDDSRIVLLAPDGSYLGDTYTLQDGDVIAINGKCFYDAHLVNIECVGPM